MFNSNPVFGFFAGQTNYETTFSGGTAITLARDFTLDQNLNGSHISRVGPNLTLLRATSATYFNSVCAIQVATINTPRFEYKSSDGVYQGFLIEEARQNNILYSSDFTQITTWAKTASSYPGEGYTTPGVKLIQNVAVAPDSTTTATLVTGTTANGFRGIYFDSNMSFTGAPNYSRTIFVKKNTARYLLLGTSNIESYFRVSVVKVFDFDTGQFVDGSIATKNMFVQSLKDGWFRLGIIQEPSNYNLQFFSIATIPSSTWSSALYTAPTGMNSFYIWGGQYEVGNYPSSYIPTSGTMVIRAADNITSPVLTGYNKQAGSLYIVGDRAFTSDVPGITSVNAFGTFSQSEKNYWSIGSGKTFPYQGLTFSRTITSTVLQTNNVAEKDTVYTLVGSISSNSNDRTNLIAYQNQTLIGNISTSLIPLNQPIKYRLGQVYNNNFLNGHILKFGYYPVSLPLSALSALP
jgi:hypothetical protein